MTDSLLFEHVPVEDPDQATVTVEPDRSADHRVEPDLFGKFCEHLGWNIYGGMEAEILRNPTFGKWPFRADEHDVDGGYRGTTNREEIRERIGEIADRTEFPDAEPLRTAYEDAIAFWWMRAGDREAVRTSPDTGPTGDRAQRFEVVDSGESGGLAQWTYMPLHRTRGYEYRIRARAAEPTTLALSIASLDEDGESGEPLTTAEVSIEAEWSTVTGDLAIPEEADLDEDGLYEVSITADGPANAVVDRLLLYPDDHVNHADPDVIDRLREADLPLLRWPGGNFVSGYDWRDGIGPVDDRPTKPNPAWGRLEYNLFGTAEFAQFCDAVGCEPMICINAGSGTPEEAAKWVEYCNGSTDTAMGALRAEHGHPEPFDVGYWEIGNEIYGKWQVRWTTPDGNVDRYRRFKAAMKEADPSIRVQACGHRTNEYTEWNERLIEGAGDEVRSITDHILTGGPVTAETDRDELFHAFMGFSEQLGREYRELEDRMRDAGIENPRLAITELQLFAHFDEDADVEDGGNGGEALTPETMPTPKTVSEPLYLASIVHECIRMGEFVELLTHSATVNHGGGLQKAKERVWADPVHYGHVVLGALRNGRPLGVTVESDTIANEETFGEIQPFDGVPALDAMAVRKDGDLLVTLINRASRDDPVSVTVDAEAVADGNEAEIVTLSGDTLSAENTLAEPEKVAPESTTAPITDGSVSIDLPPYTLARIRLNAEN